MNTYNEEDVINRLQYPETQRAAFGEVVKAYSEQLYWQIRRMVLSHDDAMIYYKIPSSKRGAT